MSAAPHDYGLSLRAGWPRWRATHSARILVNKTASAANAPARSLTR